MKYKEWTFVCPHCGTEQKHWLWDNELHASCITETCPTVLGEDDLKKEKKKKVPAVHTSKVSQTGKRFKSKGNNGVF